MRAVHFLLPLGLLWGFVACGGDDSAPTGTTGGGAGGSGGATGGSGGKSADASVDTSSGGAAGSGKAGSGGGSGSGGATGTAGKGGTAGAGTGGVGGSGGATGGTAGTDGGAGTGGSAGTAGSSGAGGSAGTGTGGAAGTAGTGGAAGSAGSAGTAGTGGTGGGGPAVSVLQHHNNANRDGVYVDPVFTKAAAATLHVDTTFAMATYTASVLAQPLYLAGNGTVPDLVIVATTQNHVIGFNAATGAKVYDQTLAPPTPSSALACSGNINPVGIVGTPVIDAATRTIYLNSMTNMSGTPQDMVYALDANTGMPKTGWPVDLNARVTNFTTRVQNQRGALALVGGRVLIPYGGHIGDCGDYRGWIVSIAAGDPTQLSTFVTRALGGGIWAPSGVVSDGTSIYFATGNTMGAVNDPTSHPAMYGDGETVFKLPPTLTKTGATTEYFVPTNWIALDDTDADIGGSSPLIVDVPGATPSKLIVQLGKDRKAYLINRDTMGGESAPLAAPVVATGAIINAPVSYRTAMGTYVVFRGAGSGCPSGTGSMTAVRITAAAPPTAAVAWCAGAASNKSPAVSMVDANGTDTLVWIMGNDNRLRAYDGDTGAVVFNGGGAGDVMTASSPFVTPIVANGRIFAASNTQTYAFRP